MCGTGAACLKATRRPDVPRYETAITITSRPARWMVRLMALGAPGNPYEDQPCCSMMDLRFAFRQLLKNPGFSAIAVLTLALGIGATTALFTVIYGVLINPYPYAKPEQIWTPGIQSPGANQRMRSYQLTEYLQMAELSVFADVMATAPGTMLLTGQFAPENLRVIRVSANAFQFLGVPALLGRTAGPSDVTAGGDPQRVVVLSFRCWQGLFSSDPNVMGRGLRLDDES